MYPLFLNAISNYAKHEIDQRVHRIVVLFSPEAKELGYEQLASGARQFDRTDVDVASCDAQASPLVLDRVHGLHAEGAALQLVDRGLLVGHSLDEELMAHVTRPASLVERLHRLTEGMRRMIGRG